MTILPVVIIADDLTGACDAAAQFLPQIRPIKVWTEVPSEISRDLRSYRVISLNTQTRDLSPHSAGEICRAAGHLLRVSGVRTILIKKIDTAFRGNVGIEIERLLDSLGLKAAVVIPSIPDLGRTTVNGVQLLEGRPIHEFFAEDPTYKLRTSKVTELISRSTRLPVGNVPLNVVRKVKEIRPAVEQALKAGFRIIVFDAASNEDIDRTVYSLLSDGLSFLFVGSLGLTAAISRYLLGARGTGHGPIHGAQTPGRGARGGTLVVCGSRHRASVQQVECLRGVEGVKTFSLEITPPGPDEFLLEDIAAALRGGNMVVLRAEQVGEITAAGSLAADYLARVTKAIGERASFEDLIILGGDTAYHVCQTLGVVELELEGVMHTVVSRGRVIKGPRSGLQLWLKGGSVGGPRILADVLDYRG